MTGLYMSAVDSVFSCYLHASLIQVDVHIPELYTTRPLLCLASCLIVEQHVTSCVHAGEP